MCRTPNAVKHQVPGYFHVVFRGLLKLDPLVLNCLALLSAPGSIFAPLCCSISANDQLGIGTLPLWTVIPIFIGFIDC